MLSPKHYLLIGIFVIFSSSLHAQNTTARFMLWQPSARSIAMGGVGSAIADNGFAVFYNPAGLAFTTGITAAGSFGKPYPFFKHTIHSLTSLSFPLKGFGTLAISANRFWRERQEFTSDSGPESINVDGKKPGFFSPTHWEAKLSYATLLNKRMSIGVNISLLRIKLSESPVSVEQNFGTTSTVLFGAGLLFRNILPEATWKPPLTHHSTLLNRYADNRERNGLSLGISLSNAGPKISFIDNAQKDNPPTIISIGTAYFPVSSPVLTLLLSTDFEKEIFESSPLDYLHLGDEITLFNIVSLCTGYFLDTNSPATSYFTIGGGIHLKFFSFNIARYKRSLLPAWHFDGTISLEL